jgi:hypothetical protein
MIYETKFSRIQYSAKADKTTLVVRLYRTTGPNTSPDPVAGSSVETYDRTLVGERSEEIPGRPTAQEIITRTKAGMEALATTLRLGNISKDLLVTLTL